MEGPTLLRSYIEAHKLTLREFASKVEAPFSLVWRWTRSKGVPGTRYALAVDAATAGAVPFRSWADHGPSKAPPESERKPASRGAAKRTAPRRVRGGGDRVA